MNSRLLLGICLSVLFFTSCKKETIIDKEVDGTINCIDGRLVFSSTNIFANTITELKENTNENPSI